MRRRVSRWLISLTLAAGAFTTLTAESGIREDELRCEEAKKHLIDCCGNDYVFDCHYVDNGCDRQPSLPALDTTQSECLLGKSCGDLHVAGCAQPEVNACE